MINVIRQYGVICLFLLATSSIRSFHLSKLMRGHLLSSRLLGSKPLSYDVEAWKRGYESCTEEIVEVISTSLPPDLEGTYFRKYLFFQIIPTYVHLSIMVRKNKTHQVFYILNF